MQRARCLLAGLFLTLAATKVERSSASGRRLCSMGVTSRLVSYLASRVQPVYQPYLTVCQGYRLCSTYRTTYRVVQHQAYRQVSEPVYRCCPGWRQTAGRPKLGCSFDVDECAGRRHGCSQVCLNLAGSYQCTCRPGDSLQADGKTCRGQEVPTDAPATFSCPAATADPRVENDVEELRRRLASLEEKFQLVLAPFLRVEMPGSEGPVPPNPMALLLHSLQQLDRIDSLSEQISFLEERLETCSCKDRH